MATVKKTAPKKAAPKSAPSKNSDGEVPKGLVLMTLENDIPIPARGGVRDPEFLKNMTELLKKIKLKQSFVVLKKKVHGTKELAKKEFEEYVLKVSVIQPEQKFARIWRVK